MSKYKYLGAQALLLPLLVLLGGSPAFAAYPNSFASAKGSAFISADTTVSPTTGSLEYIVSFYSDPARKASIDPAGQGLRVIGGADFQSPIAGYDARTSVVIPPGCLNGAGASFMSDTLTSLSCNASGDSVSVNLYVPTPSSSTDLSTYVSGFTAKVLYSQSTGHGYVDIKIDFLGYDPGVESPGALNVAVGSSSTVFTDGLYFRLNPSIISSGSK